MSGRRHIPSRRRRTVGAVGLASALVVSGSAHDLGQSASRLDVRGTVVVDSLTIDLLEFPSVDADRNGAVSYQELDRSINDVFTIIKQHLIVTDGQPPTRVSIERHEIVEGHAGRLELRYEFAQPVARLQVTSTLGQILRADHQHAVTAVVNGGSRGAVLDASRPTVSIDLGRSTSRGFLWLVTLGGAVTLLAGRYGLFLYDRRRRR